MNATPKRGLGRGFDALLPQDFDRSILLENGEKIQKVALDKIQPNKGQPRTTFDTEFLEQLASSIKQYGVLQPIIVRPTASGSYTIVAGERRWRASKLAGLKDIPAIVRSMKDLEHLELALVENIQRVDLSPLEQAVSIERLHQQFSLSYDVISERLHKAVSTVNNIARLLQLPPEARQALEQRDITEGHARAILALKNQPDQQQELLKQTIKNGWSVRQAERFVTSIKEGVVTKKAALKRVKMETPETKALAKRLNTPVQIRRSAKGGRLELSFASDEELAKLIKLLATLSEE